MSTEQAQNEQKLNDVFKTADELPEAQRNDFLRGEKKSLENEAQNNKKAKDTEKDSIKAEYALKAKREEEDRVNKAKREQVKKINEQAKKNEATEAKKPKSLAQRLKESSQRDRQAEEVHKTKDIQK